MNISTGTIEEWSDEDWRSFYRWLRDELFKQTVTISFIKADGSNRVMNCTLVTERISYQSKGKSKKQKEETFETIKAWDIDKGEWRSFKIRNITNILELILKYK